MQALKDNAVCLSTDSGTVRSVLQQTQPGCRAGSILRAHNTQMLFWSSHRAKFSFSFIAPKPEEYKWVFTTCLLVWRLKLMSVYGIYNEPANKSKSSS